MSHFQEIAKLNPELLDSVKTPTKSPDLSPEEISKSFPAIAVNQEFQAPTKLCSGAPDQEEKGEEQEPKIVGRIWC